MLRYVSLRNFRAFEAQTFDFSKINIFVGPNNSGKSSVISAINLLSQTISNPDIDQSPLILNGQFDSLGTFLDLIHGNRANTPLGIDVGFNDFEIKTTYKYRKNRREIELVKYELSRKKQRFEYATTKDSFTLKLDGIDFETLFPGVKKRKPDFTNMLPSSRMFNPFYFAVDQKAITSKSREELIQYEKLLLRARSELRRTFQDFDSISPFRDRPQRTYLYSGETARRIGTTGSNTAAILSNDASKRGAESIDMTSEISRWFRVSGIAEAVKVKTLTPRHYEIVLCDVRGAEHNICDVGFGCSQVLPVLTAALNLFGAPSLPADVAQPILVVQEPEIHLHPNAQASLGSFFAGILKSRGQIFLETHSDNLVLRIARHVVDGTLKSDDVRVFFVQKENGISSVSRVNISNEGQFKPEWPGGFFPQRQSESLSLARAAFRSKTDNFQVNEQFEFHYPEEMK